MFSGDPIEYCEFNALDMNVWMRRCRADSEVVGTFVEGPRER